MPASFRRKIRSLLPYVALHPAIADLAYCPREAGADISQSVPVQNRPWEWTEFIGDPPTVEGKAEDTEDEQGAVTNSTSIALDLFDLQITGERVFHRHQDAKVDSAVRTFFDATYGENIFQRDWQDSRTLSLIVQERPSDAEREELEDEVGPLPNFYSSKLHSGSRRTPDRPSENSRRSSPASSARSRTSLHVTTSNSASMKQSPLFSRFTGSSAADAIDVDSLSGDMPVAGPSSLKRKASTSQADDDDAEVADNSSSVKRSKPPKPKARKR